MILTSGTYADEIETESIESEAMKIPKKFQRIVLHIPRGQFVPNEFDCQIIVFKCLGYIPRTRKKTKMFSIAAISDKSVILLKNMNIKSKDFSLDRYKLIEYFVNVDPEYLYNYENY